MHTVTGLNPVEVVFFFHAATRLLFYITIIFQKSVTIHHSMALLQVVLVLIPPHKFVCHVRISYYSKLKSMTLRQSAMA
jgi:hypothetical protein